MFAERLVQGWGIDSWIQVDMRERCGIARHHRGMHRGVTSGTHSSHALVLAVPMRTLPEHPHGSATFQGGAQRLR